MTDLMAKNQKHARQLLSIQDSGQSIANHGAL